ncbi:hypothetical protein HBN65_21405 [Pseudomonas lundensis]|nr:hypothetical protein [Pseudomonas lundensis]
MNTTKIVLTPEEHTELNRRVRSATISQRGGIKQLDTLRGIGAQLQPLGLTTGYGDVRGNWCLKNIEEEQSALLQGGIPR